MEQPRLAFTAVYLTSNQGYVGFLEELPGVARARSLSVPRRCSGAGRSRACSR